MRIVRIAATIAILAGIIACDDSRAVLYVGPTRVPCVGVAEQQCLLVRSSDRAEWEYFYDHIRGFDYEPGYIYKLLVRKDRIDNPVADQSSLRWRLLRILARTPVDFALEGGESRDRAPPVPASRD